MRQVFLHRGGTRIGEAHAAERGVVRVEILRRRGCGRKRDDDRDDKQHAKHARILAQRLSRPASSNMGGVSAGRRYVPAASVDLLLPVYDPIMRLLRFSDALQPLITQAQLAPGQRVLDVGCGTGTLALLLTTAHPAVRITALDPDPKALSRARRKAIRAGASVSFARAFGDSLPYADGMFDRVFSSMMFHHVPRSEKAGVLAEIRRVLKPVGRLELLDFAGGAHSILAQVLHGSQVSASAEGRLLQRMRDAGFTDARRVGTRDTIAGVIAFYQAVV